ncbi:prefoldin subunit beta [Archaeoglobales archaeon]|nr:MAG: prefoldin subunit beta [Archaeoglobales archaeon]
MSTELPPQLQNMVAQLQQLQQQLQIVVNQRLQLDSTLKETEMALEELQKKEDTIVYKAVGGILVQTSKDEMVKELEEKTETLKIRIKTLERQEEKLKERLMELQKKVQSMLGPQAG